MAAQSHTSNPGILNQRTLEKDHKRLAALLRPGLTVLDAGCGTGAITAGIARAVGPTGHAIGIDRNLELLEQARAQHNEPNLAFEACDLLEFPSPQLFDIVSAARVLQWIADPLRAIHRLIRLVKPGGLLVALDYNHASNLLEPLPPLAFRRFYDAFLAWRDSHGWDNQMGDHLPGLFAAAGLKQVASTNQDEPSSTCIWGHVLHDLGPQMIAEGAISSEDCRKAGAALAEYCQTEPFVQTLILRAVVGERETLRRSDVTI